MSRLPLPTRIMFYRFCCFTSVGLSLTLMVNRDKAAHEYTLLFMPAHINVCVIRDNVWQATQQRRQFRHVIFI